MLLGFKNIDAVKESLNDKYQNEIPTQWGENTKGVKTIIDTEDKILALTMDACGSKHGMKFDKELIDFLIKEKIPATLFINARWIDKNPEIFNALAANQLFEIENHGLLHKPASVNGKSIYNIEGTRNIDELVDEIELNALKIEDLTGKKPKFYRSGTAYYDEIAVKIANDLGEQVAGFSILGDKGATFNAKEVRDAFLSARGGEIIIIHFNHPESQTFEGAGKALLELKSRGFTFVKLEDFPLK
jgi:peptidoglycan/xylan/chitin deacetylase (PgdA/CDA1 family)